jgi:hypothetical protein
VKPTSPDPLENTTTTKTRFFVNKTHQKPEYDLVIVGDSRALRDVSPAAMKTRLGATRIFNFAFHAGGMNDEIFSAAEELFAPDAERKAIILAPTALSFMAFKQANSQFHEYLGKPRDVVWEYTRVLGLVRWFQPISPGLIFRNAIGDKPARVLEQDYHEDGWIATNQTPHDDVADLDLPRQRVTGHRVAEEQIAAVMERTRQWRRQGIEVYAFFPPAYAPRVAMEDSVLGFDRERFIAEFRQSGGIWLDVGTQGFESYDGSHLVRSSALALSENLGALVAGHRR